MAGQEAWRSGGRDAVTANHDKKEIKSKKELDSGDMNIDNGNSVSDKDSEEREKARLIRNQLREKEKEKLKSGSRVPKRSMDVDNITRYIYTYINIYKYMYTYINVYIYVNI
jgi:hypothetical protein